MLCLKQLKQEELADSLQSSKRTLILKQIQLKLLFWKKSVIDSYFYSFNIKYRLNDIMGERCFYQNLD